jgi:hypothetical protein
VINTSELELKGFTKVIFPNTNSITELQKLISSYFKTEILDWHVEDISQEEHVSLVKKITDEIVTSGSFIKVASDNLNLFTAIFGPDIDIQTVPHLRISRPKRESDLVNWHRDTFYGNSPWELNLWLPIFPLEEGAGLKLLPCSHRATSRNIRDELDPDEFRSTVKKGSTADQIGYIHSPKTDDTISNLKPGDIVTLTPKVGEAILFFGCMVHRAINQSPKTRISMDFRLKTALAPTGTRNGYYRSLCRGVIANCVQEFLRPVSDS